MTKKKEGNNSVKRSIARGGGVRGTSGINNNGATAYAQARKSTKGHYKVEFSHTYENMTDRDVELRIVYGKDLVARSVGVPSDMLRLVAKKKNGEQTLTSLDEVFYVKVGDVVYGKLSIRTQRVRKGVMLFFIFQVKKAMPQPHRKSYSHSRGYKKRTAGQVSEGKRRSYRNKQGGKS